MCRPSQRKTGRFNMELGTIRIRRRGRERNDEVKIGRREVRDDEG